MRLQGFKFRGMEQSYSLSDNRPRRDVVKAESSRNSFWDGRIVPRACYLPYRQRPENCVVTVY
jgi:hypothetical protein